jgi:hypothetical protein
MCASDEALLPVREKLDDAVWGLERLFAIVTLHVKER